MSNETDTAAQLIYPPHASRNAASLLNIKFLTSAYTGAIAGVLGLTNWRGFALYAFSMLFTSFLVYHLKCKGGIPPSSKFARPEGGLKRYFHGSVWDLINPGQDNIFSFVLSWTLFYGIVHVYD